MKNFKKPETESVLLDSAVYGLYSSCMFEEELKDHTKMPIVHRIWQTPGGYTTIEWTDCTKTTVQADDPEKATEYGGFCACLAKKLYGSTTKAIYMMNSAKKRTELPKLKRAIERDKRKKRRAQEAENAKKLREEKIQAQMEAIRIRAEAEYRLRQIGGEHQ